jgi:8-amino-7-oxononanoate synthase
MSELRVLQGPGRTNFAGNDYLGLSRQPRVVEALCAAARECGVSSTSSRWALGWTELHARLEAELAAFFGAADATVFGATYLAGPAYFEVMGQGHDTAFIYENSHPNLFLGARAAGMEIKSFAHGDVEGLRRQLQAYSGSAPVIATDGVYSICGDVAPAAELAALAREFDAELLIDDAHGVFAIGETGKGLIEPAGVSPNDAAVMGSMSKALGCNGGFIAGRSELVEKLRRTAPASGSSLPPPAIVAACVEALRIVREEPQLRARLHEHADRMRAALAGNGIGVVADATPIVAMVLADEAEAAGLAEHFLGYKLVIPYFKYASEPRHNLLRSVARSCYTEDELARFAEAVTSWRQK